MDQSTFLAKVTRTIDATTRDGDQVVYEFLPFIRTYKSGRIQRLVGTASVPPSPSDPETGVSSKDASITPDSSVSARLFLPKSSALSPGKKLPVVVYYHGGAFVCEHNASPFYHNYLNSLVSHANVVAVSINYRIAPEHPLPAAYLDSWTALEWVASKKDPWLAEHGDLEHLFIMGDSAGGNICHWVAMKAGGEELPGKVGIQGMALVHSYFWGKEPLGSESREPAYREAMEKSWRFVYPEAGEEGADHPWVNPIVAGAPSLRGLGCKRVLACIGGEDFFKERGLAYVGRLKESGWEGEVEVLVSEGQGHVFHIARPNSDKAVEMMERVCSFINPDF